MLFCDHILFWHEHRLRPALEWFEVMRDDGTVRDWREDKRRMTQAANAAAKAMFRLSCSADQFVSTMRKLNKAMNLLREK